MWQKSDAQPQIRPNNLKLPMYFRHVAIATIASLSFCAAMAQQSDESKKSMLFLEAVAAPKKARVCAAHIEGFATKFEPVFQKWQQVNQTQLAEGETLLRSEAEKSFASFDQNVQAVTNLSAHMLAKASPAVIEENCNAMLVKLGAASPIETPNPPMPPVEARSSNVK